MNRKLVSEILVTLMLIGMLTLTFNIQTTRAEPKTWYVDDDGGVDFTEIQDAIDVAEPGDTIYVYNGAYYENVVVNKNNLTLVGENKHSTIIDANGVGTVVYITANNVSVSGFTIQGSGYGGWHSGIWIHDSSGNYIKQNILTNNQAGILLRYSSGNSVIENTAISNTYDGITLHSSSNNIIAGNIASNGMYGIALSFFSDNNIIARNNVSNNDYGISLWYDSDGNRVIGNNASNNNYGIYLFDSSNNLVFHNNFIDNTIQVHDWGLMTTWYDYYPSCGNYWSDYTDQDFFIGPGQDQPGSDGVWDHPYAIDGYQDKYPLVNPWTPSWIPPSIPPGLFADLIRRKAWLEHHHYDISRDEDGYQTLFANVKNLGNQTAWVKALFNITRDGGSSNIVESQPLLIMQEDIAELSVSVGPLTNLDTGKYFVSAVCWYSHNKVVWVQGEKKKMASFTVVP